MNRSNGLRNTIAVFLMVCVSCNCLSIGTVSEGEHVEKNVTKRASNGDFFPDWVPFKNKNGEELGEFVPVKKAKPKKRLALPANFVLKSVAEPQGDDYYGQGQGESESDDYYEKKEWSDINRPAEEGSKHTVKHTDLSDIDGVVNIITQRPGKKSSRIRQKTESSEEETDKLQNAEEEFKKSDEAPVKKTNEINKEEIKDEISENDTIDDKEEVAKEEHKEESSDENNSTENNNDKRNRSDKKVSKKQESEENDYDEKPVENPKTQVSEEERREQEARKAKILESVDKLKERHANEQRLLSEKLKEEELFIEEAERDNLNTNERHDKYGHAMRHRPIDYDDYDEHIVEDKYKIRTLERITTTTTRAPTKSPRRKKQKYTEKPKQQYESGKLSVFKHPSAYMIYDYDDSKTTTTVVPEVDSAHSFENSSSHDKSVHDNASISFVPGDSDGKQGEPTLFFVRKRKNKRRKHKSTSARPLDSTVAETVTKKAETDFTTNSVTGIESSPSAVGISLPSAPHTTSKESPSAASTENTAPSGFETAPSGFSSAPSAPETHKPSSEDTTGVTGSAEVTSPGGLEVLSVNDSTTAVSAPSALAPDKSTTAVSAPSALAPDTISAPSEHKKEVPKHENSEHERGGEKEHHSEFEDSHEEHGKKAYEGVHKDTKTKKGHHDKEDHHKEYDDHGGSDKSHHEEKGHYGNHHHEEQGKKHAKYEETGKHSKGHSTKGSHDIHKKEEYEKKVEFFEEEGDSAEEEKHGGHTQERGHESGGHFKKNDLEGGFHGQLKGDTGGFVKGGHGFGDKGHKSAAGHDSHGKHGASSYHHGGREAGKKWIYHHGHPPKTANLVVIDRRGDNYFHGPHYYG